MSCALASLEQEQHRTTARMAPMYDIGHLELHGIIGKFDSFVFFVLLTLLFTGLFDVSIIC